MEKAADNGFKWSVTPTGIAGLDEVLYGGLTYGSINLLEGESGTGKTNLGLQFGFEGLRQGESVLYVALSETRQDIEMVAQSHGWDITELNILEAASAEEGPTSIFHPSEVELGETIQRLKQAVERVKPARLVLDSLSEFRILGQNTLRYRRALLSLKRFLGSIGCTVLLLDEPGGRESPRSLVDGVIVLEAIPRSYGADRRQLRILKLRGRPYSGGYHDFTIRTGGLLAFPRLIAAEHSTEPQAKKLLSGLQGLDALTGGGIKVGTSTLLIGPAGVGKSSIAALYAKCALKRGEDVLYFTFDEQAEHILRRAEGLNLDLRSAMESGRLHLQQIDPAELSPGELADTIRQHIQTGQVGVVVIDSLNGYLHAMPDERFLVAHLHELLIFLGQQGASTFLVVSQTGVGIGWETPLDTSYLADNLILLRFFESEGEIRRAISVVKQRTGYHESKIRELRFNPGSITIGEALHQFQGVLSGTPIFTGSSDHLLEGENDISS